jgi:hypothetical protein
MNDLIRSLSLHLITVFPSTMFVPCSSSAALQKKQGVANDTKADENAPGFLLVRLLCSLYKDSIVVSQDPHTATRQHHNQVTKPAHKKSKVARKQPKPEQPKKKGLLSWLR